MKTRSKEEPSLKKVGKEILKVNLFAQFANHRVYCWFIR